MKSRFPLSSRRWRGFRFRWFERYRFFMRKRRFGNCVLNYLNVRNLRMRLRRRNCRMRRYWRNVRKRRRRKRFERRCWFKRYREYRLRRRRRGFNIFMRKRRFRNRSHIIRHRNAHGYRRYGYYFRRQYHPYLHFFRYVLGIFVAYSTEGYDRGIFRRIAEIEIQRRFSRLFR